jgi:hypothetical protein
MGHVIGQLREGPQSPQTPDALFVVARLEGFAQPDIFCDTSALTSKSYPLFTVCTTEELLVMML